MKNDKNKEKIYSISYNSDGSLMALATNRGFKVYSTNPAMLKQERDFGAPIAICELINRSNLIGLVGFKQTPFAPPNKLAIFDDNTQRIIADLSFKERIKNVKIRNQRIVVALSNKVFLIGLFEMEILHIIETFKFDENQHYNIISLSNDPYNFLLAAPGTENGHVLLVYLNKLTERVIKAHNSILSAVQISHDGEKLATTSEKGINIRIFDTRTGQMIQEVRRGNQFATIYSLAFSYYGNWLSVSSDSCNIHTFAIKLTESQKNRNYAKNNLVQKQNPKSMFYFMKKLFSHFDAQYSFCSYKLEQFSSDVETNLVFLLDDSLLIMSNAGVLERVKLADQPGGKCLLEEKRYLIQPLDI